jgi:hypothetical protein
MKIRILGIASVLSLAITGCIGSPNDTDGIQGVEVEAAALSTPTVLELINTCDQSAVRLAAGSNNSFILDPGDNSQRFASVLSTSKVNCAVGVKFNVPAGQRARLRLATSIGNYGAGAGSAIFTHQAGFTNNRRPLRDGDLNFGPSLIETKFLPEHSHGTVDLQLDSHDPDTARVVTECGARNQWFYVRPRLAEATGVLNVTLGLIHGSFQLEACP